MNKKQIGTMIANVIMFSVIVGLMFVGYVLLNIVFA